jgi:hypothetical protein
MRAVVGFAAIVFGFSFFGFFFSRCLVSLFPMGTACHSSRKLSSACRGPAPAARISGGGCYGGL